MSGEIRVPRLGWSMDEGTFLAWLKREGDIVSAGEPLFTLEGDKSTQDVEAIDSGALRWLEDGPQPGDTVKVGQVIGHLERTEVTASFTEPPEPATTGAEVIEAISPPLVGEIATTRTTPPGEDRQKLKQQKSSPRARRVAEELGVDWARLTGSGDSGRVRERDVRAAAAGMSPARDTILPITPIRKTIANRMLTSLRTTAPVTLTTRADATSLVQLRKQFKSIAGAGGTTVPSYTDLVVKLAARMLANHPRLNSRREDERIILHSEVHIGLAVDTDSGLVVPVIRDVAKLGVRQVAARAQELIAKARQQRLSPEDQRGGTFTVTNLGMYGIDAFTPIINPPETAILGLGAIRREVVCHEGDRISACDQIILSLTFDHQVIDGAPAARFLQDLSHGLENVAALLVE